MCIFTFYVPKSHLDIVKEAVFAAGAGTIGEYKRCAWQILGTGQFEPTAGANPFIGTKNKLEIVDEYKVEMVVKKELVSSVLEAFRNAHPYEEPAFSFVETLTV